MIFRRLMSRCLLPLLASYLLAISFTAPAKAAQRPNVVFLFADDQRPDTIAAHGNPYIRTPNLDRIATEGFSFRQNYCAGSYSGAVCVATRAMLMTGRHWMRIGDKKNWDGLETLPERLGRHGYATFAVGKWHNGRATLTRSFQAGEAVFLGGMSDHTKVPLRDLGPGGQLINERTGQGFSSTLFADSAVGFLRSYDQERPFFLYVAFTAPHDPRMPPEAHRQYYYDNRPPLPPNFLPQLPFNNGHMAGGRDENLAAWPRDPEVIRDQLCEYYGMISHLDEQVGRVLESLRNSPHAGNTIVVYAADHGLAMGSHGLLGKQNVYEHSMGCPLIVRGPGIPQGESTAAMTYLLDLYPTLCKLARVEVPEQVDGEDLAPLWAGTKASVRDSVFLPYQGEMRAVRDARWKLIVYPQIGHRELFDLANDPHERRSLAEDPRYAGELRRLLRTMRSWQDRVGDEQPLVVEQLRAKEIDLTGRERKPDKWQPAWIREKYFQAPKN